MTAAAARAAHLIVDGEPVIFADTVAEAMLGERAEEFIAYHRAYGAHPVLAGARAQVTCRSRYAEDQLARAVRDGIGQYVILGAGLDTFAYRSPLARRVRVFEVDHPATQGMEAARRTGPGGRGLAANGPRGTGRAGTGLRSTGPRGTGLAGTELRSTGLRSTGLRSTGLRSTGLRVSGLRVSGFGDVRSGGPGV